MPAQAARGVVSIPALDLRANPSHASELRSQLILGEVVRVLGRPRSGGWLEVRNLSDGYAGWARTWGLVEASAARAKKWAARARARVVATYLEVRADAAGAGTVSPLYWGSRVIPGARRGAVRRVELPDGRRGWVRSAGLETRGHPGIRLRGRIASLMGAPYLWGGRTPFGLDCSGFTQLVLGEQGTAMPRDCRDQFEATRPVGSDEEGREGDLVFFGVPGKGPSHVGIALGGGYYAHVRGQVKLASLDSCNPLFDNELITQYMGMRRAPIRGQ